MATTTPATVPVNPRIYARKFHHPANHASTDFVWHKWQNSTGYSSNGFIFCLGMLNGAFAVSTPDVITRLAKEITKPSQKNPKAILAQFIVGLLTALFYLIAIFYSINDLDFILNRTYLFPLTSTYRQATRSAGGSLGLLLLAFIPSLIASLGRYLTASRVFWTLARDNATPFSSFFATVNQRQSNPFNSIICAQSSVHFSVASTLEAIEDTEDFFEHWRKDYKKRHHLHEGLLKLRGTQSMEQGYIKNFGQPYGEELIAKVSSFGVSTLRNY